MESFTLMEKGLLEILVLNRIDDIDALEARGFNPDGNRDLRNAYAEILAKLRGKSC